MKKIIFPLLTVSIIAAAVLIFLWASSYKKGQPVQTVGLQLASLNASISTNGKIEADKIYEIHAPFSGVCARVQAKGGARLTASQPILTIEDTALRPEVAAAKAELDAAESELHNIRRGPAKEEVGTADAEIAKIGLDLSAAQKILETNEWLLKRDAVSRSEVEQSRRETERLVQSLDAAKAHRKDLDARYAASDFKRAESRVEAARAKMGLTEGNVARLVVRAPASGTLYHFDLREGSFVNAGDLLGLMADLSQMRVRAYVDEPELGATSVGAAAVIRWDAYPGSSWRGRVQFIPLEVVTRGTRSVAEVLCSIDDSPGRLIPNVNVDVEIISADERKVQALPRSALILSGKEHYVWTIRNDRVVRRSVEIGRSTSSFVEIRGGISPAEQVILPGEAPISEGLKVRVEGK